MLFYYYNFCINEIYLLYFFSKSKNCYINKDLKQWNEVIFDKLNSINNKKKIRKQFLTYKVRDRFGHIKSTGKITHLNSNVEIYWNNQLLVPTKTANRITVLNDLKEFFNTSETETNCAQIMLDSNKIKSKDRSNKKTTTVMISELTESEWWTMVRLNNC